LSPNAATALSISARLSKPSRVDSTVTTQHHLRNLPIQSVGASSLPPPFAPDRFCSSAWFFTLFRAVHDIRVSLSLHANTKSISRTAARGMAVGIAARISHHRMLRIPLIFGDCCWPCAIVWQPLIVGRQHCETSKKLSAFHLGGRSAARACTRHRRVHIESSGSGGAGRSAQQQPGLRRKQHAAALKMSPYVVAAVVQATKFCQDRLFKVARTEVDAAVAFAV